MDICNLIIATTTTLQLCYNPVCHPSADGTKSLCFDLHQCGASTSLPTYECKRPDGSTYTYQIKDFNDLVTIIPD